LSLPLDEARRNDEVIALADSQMMRWIDELNGTEGSDETAIEIKKSIAHIRKKESTLENRRELRKLYKELDKVQFKPDYLNIVIEKNKDYYRACKGFTVNGITYKRLLGTNGGIKNSTIVFVSERLHPELHRRIENDRDMNKPLVTAKLEAYKALTCSASTPMPRPNRVLIVPDVKTTFKADYIYLTDEADGEPVMELKESESVTKNATDGFGLILPSLAESWGQTLGLDYLPAGMNTRFAFEKGMVFTFDFLDFANTVSKQYLVKDAWGDTVDIREVDLVLTTSMVKLWDSYESADDYFSASYKNGYAFGVTKVSERQLESERTLNYQFIQSYELDDEDIDKLIAPTIENIEGVLHKDWAKTALFLHGSSLKKRSFDDIPDDFTKAILVEPEVIRDSYVQSTLYGLIRNRINQAKIGVLDVHANYSIVSGDPYLLCESIFGIEPKGILRSDEIYNKYWSDQGSDRVACYRAPMTCHNNIRLMNIHYSDEAAYWYRYMDTVTIFNAWDMSAAALNGMDYDGDLVMLTDNEVLVSKLKKTPVLMCVQRGADKRVSSEEDFIKSNIDSFGNDIGKTTNWITSMFEVRDRFEKDSAEYKELTYRIQCGQNYQQNAIDKAKGIVCKPMPKSWYNRHAVNKIKDEEEKIFYRSIVADKKPYFMRYIYPSVMRQYNTFDKNTTKNALREFGMTVNELMALPYNDLTERQREFLRHYSYRMPVGMSDCVMNRICRVFEERFDGYLGNGKPEDTFDYNLFKSDKAYTTYQFNRVKSLYDEYNNRLKSYAVFTKYERVDSDESFATISIMNNEFRRACDIVCSDEELLCNIILDISYRTDSTKQFAWAMCGEQMIKNLLKNTGGYISVPVEDADGEISYGGKRYTVIKGKLGKEDEYHNE
jgi:hypothetical protein